MRLRERAVQIDRVQQSMPFKIVASIVVVVAALLLSISYTVAVNASENADLRLDSDLTIGDTGTGMDAAARALEDILDGRKDVTSVFAGAAIGTAVMLGAIWLHIGLTSFLVLLLGAVVAWPMMMIDSTASWGRLLAGVLVLGLSFVAIMRVLGAVFSFSNPVCAVARNVLTEALRMKVTILFILLLVLGMVYLPEHLRSDQPLRYRVQSFLQYGTGGSFWVIALLTLVFSVSSVAFEQRDRTIWQTVTKPISSWQYVLGKWLGVVCLNAALLGVSTSGVFMFTEYLRMQPALGESRAYESPDGGISEDRMILETQVLTANVRVGPDEPTISSPEFRQNVEQFIANQRIADPNFATEPDEQQRIAEDLYKSYIGAIRSVPPGDGRRFTFRGLEASAERNVPLTLRYRIDSGSNRPDIQYDISFSFNNDIFVVRQVGLGYTHTVTVPPGTVGSDGVLEVDVYNIHMGTGQPNPQSISFPENAISISYSAGSYQVNFVKAIFVLWLKLAFLAMVGVCASTFLSFPVAAMVAFGVFLCAESASFLTATLEYYGTTNTDGDLVPHKLVTYYISMAVGWVFAIYAELRPTTFLVDGRLLTFGAVAQGTIVLGVLIGLLYAIGTMVFRRRELAMYSGH